MSPVESGHVMAHSAAVSAPRTKMEKIWHVVKQIFIVLAGAFTYYFNPTLCLSGFLIGIIISDKIKEVISKIVRVLQKQFWTSSFLIGLAAYLALPVAAGATSFLIGGHFGSEMEINSR